MERLDKMEKMITRLGRRAAKQTSAIISPVPVSSCIVDDNIDGIILRYLFTCPGEISKGGIFLNKRPDSGARLTISIENESGGSNKSYNIEKKKLSFEPKLKVDTWDRLSIKFSVNDSEKDNITEIWTGFIWTPTIKDTLIKHFLIDKLDEVENVYKEGN